MTDVRPFGPTQAAELVDADAKRWATAQAIGTLAGFECRRVVTDTGAVRYLISGRAFDSLDALEQWLDGPERPPHIGDDKCHS